MEFARQGGGGGRGGSDRSLFFSSSALEVNGLALSYHRRPMQWKSRTQSSELQRSAFNGKQDTVSETEIDNKTQEWTQDA